MFEFFATLFVYTFQRFGKLKINLAFSGPRLDWMLANLIIVKMLMLFSVCFAAFFAIAFNWETLLLIFPFGLIAGLYVGKFPFHFPFNLRDIPFIKAHLIALTWSGMSVVIPMAEYGLSYQPKYFLFFGGIYLFIFSLAIVFDARDVDLDEPSKRTVPQIVGKKGALILSCGLIGIAFLIFYLVGNYPILPFVSMLTFVELFVINSWNKKDDLYYSFYLDGLIVLTGSSLCHWMI